MTRDEFTGTWVVTRRITDRYSDQLGQFDGEATLTPDGTDGLIYDERGTARLGDGPQMQAERRYLWAFTPDGVIVRFADGRHFHSFVPEGEVAGTEHPCGEDLYRAVYDFTQWPQWSATWEVQGPRKDYTMVSHYRRG